MQIDLSPADRQKLEQLAKETGFDSVESLVGEHLRFLANFESAREILALNERELSESLATCDRGIAELEAGAGQDAVTALQELGRRRGFSAE
ncbi:hypothetical protein [Blastopirellula marina]|uniref:Uncharacterized protein n=1 Tax=Blastopirellula marina TaxID=124 RepID=A0A2S8GHW8_9BACT|nr:hypothetical protein [Blastopirellula marina]PQO44027.1 hypothetical protein C5Y93_21025 [Blastopirellula marina]